MPLRVLTRALSLAALFAAVAGSLSAQDSTKARSTGLPSAVQWKFNIDVGLGWFTFGNSLYTDVRPDPSGDLGANWGEAFAKPAISAVYPLKKSEFYGKLSAVGEGTYAAPPTLVGSEANSFRLEDAAIGWRSGSEFSMGENVLDVSLGREVYKVGHGMLVWDGAAEGGSYGGFWSNARKAWQFAGVATFAPKKNKVDVFYLDRAELPENNTDTKLWGVNYEYTLREGAVIGASFFDFSANPSMKPERDGEKVYDVRFFGAPLKVVPELAFELEYAHEDNGSLLKSTGWNAKVAYSLSKVTWSPVISYRYAYFQGDNPQTTVNEAFDALLPGFYDWGTWWQGEIAGEYFLSNSNLISNQIRVHVTPTKTISGGIEAYSFKVDNRESWDPLATSSDLATELDVYTDWQADKNFLFSFMLSIAKPGDALVEKYNRTSNFLYGMIYVVYSY